MPAWPQQRGFSNKRNLEPLPLGEKTPAQTHLQCLHVGLIDVREPQAQGYEEHQGSPRPSADLGCGREAVTVPAGVGGQRSGPCTRNTSPAQPS